jgi:hypothetical protein
VTPEKIQRRTKHHSFAFKEIATPQEWIMRRDTSIRTLALVPDLHDDEKIAFDYFTTFVLSSLKLTTPQATWLDAVACQSLSNTDLRQCCLAFAAAYKVRNQYEERRVPAVQISVESLPAYIRGIVSLRRQLDACQPDETTTQMSYAVCIMTECLLGRQSGIQTHLKYFTAFNNNSGHARQPNLSETRTILDGLNLLNMLLGQPDADHLKNTGVLDGTVEWGHIVPFHDSPGAHVACADLCRQILGFIRSIENDWLESDFQALCIYKRIDSALDNFTVMVEHLANSTGQENAILKEKSVKLLLAQICTARVLLHQPPLAFNFSEMTQVKQFKHILDLLEDYTYEFEHEKKPLGLLSLGTGVIAILAMLGTHCSDTSVRRRVLALLRKVPPVEGMWSAAAIRMLLLWVIEYEATSSMKILRTETEQVDVDTFSLTLRFCGGSETKIFKDVEGISET